MQLTTRSRSLPALLAVVFAAALAGAASAEAQEVGSKPEAARAQFPTAEQALLGRSPRLTIQAVPAAEAPPVATSEALLHRYRSRPHASARVRQTVARRPVCGEMALLHRHTPRGERP